MTHYQKIELFSPAKVNLFLEVTGRLASGYHSIRTLIAPIGLGDDVVVSLSSPEDISVEVSFDEKLARHLKAEGAFASDCAALRSEGNLACRAAEEYLRRFLPQGKQGIHISIFKRTPLRAGLGGGSSNAAAVLRGLPVLLDQWVLRSELLEVAAGLGSDVVPLMYDGIVAAAGTGNQVTPATGGRFRALSGLKDMGLVIVKPAGGVPTADAYRELGYSQVNPSELTPGEATGTSQWPSFGGNPGKLFELLRNDLEGPAQRLCPEIRAVREALTASGAELALVTGSGSAVVGYCGSMPAAQKVADRVQSECPAEWFVEATGLRL